MLSIENIFEDCVLQDWVSGPLDTQYAVVIKDNVAHITFMGSVSWVDWISNFMFWKVPYKDMKIKWYAHAGFLDAWKAVQDTIIQKILWCKTVHVYGYSRGAAIALLCHEDLVYRDFEVSTTVFGAPRVFAGYGISRIQERFENIRVYNNRGDIVTGLPPKIFGYSNVGNIKWMGKKRLFPSVKRHLIPEYRKELEQL